MDSGACLGIHLNQKSNIMKKLTAIAILILFTCVIMAQDKYVELIKDFSKQTIAQGGDNYYDLILIQASEEWGTDYSMVSYEVKKQCKALYEFLEMEKPNRMTENTYSAIRAKAMSKWMEWDSNDKIIKADWEMVMYEIKKQIKAYLKIH